MGVKIKDTAKLENIRVNTEPFIKAVANDCIDYIHQNIESANIGGKDYKNSFVIDYEDGRARVWSPQNYRLVHLLEYGHMVTNQHGRPKAKGTKKKTAPRPHMRKAYNQTKHSFKKHKDKIKINMKGV